MVGLYSILLSNIIVAHAPNRQRSLQPLHLLTLILFCCVNIFILLVDMCSGRKVC